MTDENRQEIAKQLAIELASRTRIPPRRPDQGFKTFGEFKRAMGAAGTGQAWHHIVGQTTSNLQKFGADAIHNTGNLVRLPHGKGSIHQEISNLYNSVQPALTSSLDITVREWIGTSLLKNNKTLALELLELLEV